MVGEALSRARSDCVRTPSPLAPAEPPGASPSSWPTGRHCWSSTAASASARPAADLRRPRLPSGMCTATADPGHQPAAARRVGGEAVIAVPPLTVPTLTVPPAGTPVPPEGLRAVQGRRPVRRPRDAGSLGLPVVVDERLGGRGDQCGAGGESARHRAVAARSDSVTRTPAGAVTDRYRLLSRGPRDVPNGTGRWKPASSGATTCVRRSSRPCGRTCPCSRAGATWGGHRSLRRRGSGTGRHRRPDVRVGRQVGRRGAGGHRGRGQVRLPESLAEFGRQQLLGEGQIERWQQHLDWCADLAAGFRVQWVGDQQAALLRRARAEHDNIRAALEFAVADGTRAGSRRVSGSPRTSTPSG